MAKKRMKWVLGIDLGTSYFKVALVDTSGHLRGLGRVAVEKDAPEPDRCELPVSRFRNFLKEGLSRACAAAVADPRDIEAVAYSSQASSFLLLDEQAAPLTPLVLWPDARSGRVGEQVQRLWRRKDFLKTTGMSIPANPNLLIEKVLWFRENQPELWDKAVRMMTISDLLTFYLTGQTKGDAGTASLLGILNVRQPAWWEEALRELDLNPSLFSSPLRPGSRAGAVTEAGAEWLGLRSGIPFVAGSLDHYVAALGAGVGEAADCSVSLGTVLAAVRRETAYAPRTACCVGPGFAPGEFTSIAFSGNGACSLEWYRNQHAPRHTLEDLGSLAEAIAPGANGLIAFPEANTYPGLTGFRGSTRQHEHGHFTRALMESSGYTLCDLMEALYPDGTPKTIAATGGGCKSAAWLQILADMLNADVLRIGQSESACRGASMLAAVAAGWFPGLSEASRAWTSVEAVYHPEPARHQAYRAHRKRAQRETADRHPVRDSS